MVEQIINIGFEIPQKGHYVLELISIVKKDLKSKSSGKSFSLYEADFEIRVADVDVEVRNIKVSFFKSEMGPLLLALGAVEIEPNKYKWDDEKVIGEVIECDLIHSSDTRGQTIVKLIEIKSFDKNKLPNKKNDVLKAWDE